MQGAQVRSLVRELRSHMPRSQKLRKEKTKGGKKKRNGKTFSGMLWEDGILFHGGDLSHSFCLTWAEASVRTYSFSSRNGLDSSSSQNLTDRWELVPRQSAKHVIDLDILGMARSCFSLCPVQFLWSRPSTAIHMGYSAQYPHLGSVQQAASICINSPALTSWAGARVILGPNDLKCFFIFIPSQPR